MNNFPFLKTFRAPLGYVVLYSLVNHFRIITWDVNIFQDSKWCLRYILYPRWNIKVTVFVYSTDVFMNKSVIWKQQTCLIIWENSLHWNFRRINKVYWNWSPMVDSLAFNVFGIWRHSALFLFIFWWANGVHQWRCADILYGVVCRIIHRYIFRNPNKHLRWSFLWKLLPPGSRQFSQKASS